MPRSWGHGSRQDAAKTQEDPMRALQLLVPSLPEEVKGAVQAVLPVLEPTPSQAAGVRAVDKAAFKVRKLEKVAQSMEDEVVRLTVEAQEAQAKLVQSIQEKDAAQAEFEEETKKLAETTSTKPCQSTLRLKDLLKPGGEDMLVLEVGDDFDLKGPELARAVLRLQARAD